MVENCSNNAQFLEKLVFPKCHNLASLIWTKVKFRSHVTDTNRDTNIYSCKENFLNVCMWKVFKFLQTKRWEGGATII